MLRTENVSDKSRKIVIVEDDNDLSAILQTALEQKGYRVTAFSDASDAAASMVSSDTDLVILDVFLNGISGIDLLKKIHDTAPGLPVLMISGMGTIATAVEAIKRGAVDFLEKPFPLERFMTLVDRFAAVERQPCGRDRTRPSDQRLTLLTGREHEVLQQIARGASSKEAGRVLGISPRTVDVHRARIKEKLNVRRAVDLVRLVYSGAGRA